MKTLSLVQDFLRKTHRKNASAGTFDVARWSETNFSKENFSPIKNSKTAKPHGGCWASPLGSKLPWEIWCQRESFPLCGTKHILKIREDARVLYLRTEEDLIGLPHLCANEELFNHQTHFLDFEAIALEYDAIDLRIGYLYYEMYLWDLDSFLILNPDIVVDDIDTGIRPENLSR